MSDGSVPAGDREGLEAPVTEGDRIQSLDVLRGFALLGILLLNILGFGLISANYSNPGIDVTQTFNITLVTWASVELFGEGIMRCLFSILFGAGVVLFTSGRKHAFSLHYNRTFWLLMFGIFNAYILLWNGDILITYAISGAILFWFRNLSARTLMIAGLAVTLMSATILMMLGKEYTEAKAAYDQVHVVDDLSPDHAELLEQAAVWEEFLIENFPSQDAVEAELSARKTSYWTALEWNTAHKIVMTQLALPAFLIWDALAMMLFGMAFYKAGVLQNKLPRETYIKLAVIGLGAGLVVNFSEVWRAYSSGFAALESYTYIWPTYHLGRFLMAIGYIGAICLALRSGLLAGLMARFAAVGRMALTNYLMHSAICLFLFTGAGFALVGELSRPQLYIVVLAIWIFQLIVSPWWLSRYYQGPFEWLWRTLTYGKMAKFKR